MSLVFNMVGGGSGGGGGYTYAFIVVTYPAGSTCTVSDGTTTLTAPDTSGSWACKVPNAGTWTVSCTDGTHTATAPVVISTEGQSESVELSYNVPAEYQAVEYIESTGTQRISVPLAATKNINALKMVADITITEQSSSSALLGDTYNQPYFKFVDFRSATAIYPTCTANGAVDGTSDPSLLNTRAKLTYEGSGGTINIYKADTLWYSGTRSTKSMSSLSLLATYNGTSYSPMAAKLYKFEVYDTDHTTLLHDCYPCYRKSDNVAGLWDKAAETFYTNAGTGTFVVGPDL